MYIHKEGRRLILVVFLIILAIYTSMALLVQQWTVFHYIFAALLFFFWLALASFFRIPRRIFTDDAQRLISPADGVVVTVEETYEKEYIKSECVQLSVFMNIHGI